MLVSRAVLFSPRERASSTRGATRCVSGFSHGVRAWQVGCQAGTTRARVSNVPNPTRGFTSLSRWVNPNAAAFQHAPVGTATKVVSFRKSQSIAGEPGRLFTHKRHQPLRGNRPSRQYTTKIRNYFGKDDVAIGKAVAYCKGGVPKLAVVTSAPFRRLLQVTDGDGTADKVELKHVLNVFECVFPSVSVDSRTGVNCAFDLSTKAGKRSFEARFGGRLKKATELARHWVDEDEKGNGAALRQAWEKALSKQSDALPSPQYETTENSDGSLVRIPSGGNPPVAAEALAAGFPFFVEKTTGVDETEQERFAASYAAHVLLSSKNGVTFFSPHSKGRFSARSGKDVEIMSARSDEQDEENEQRREAWRVVRDAIDLPSSRKPAKETFVESCNLESRDGATADLQTESQTAAKLHITRSIQSMEAYALGSGRYTQGQLACAKQALQKLGMRSSEKSARDCLVSIGRWDGYEDLSWRRWEIPVGFEPRVDLYAEGLASGTVTAPPDLDKDTRKDLTRLTAYAIDGRDTQEIDDAIGAEATADGKVRVWIHVADASRWSPVAEDASLYDAGVYSNILDASARQRGASAYAPDGTVPMFPFAIAGRDGPMSLGPPGVDKCALSITAVVNTDNGEVTEYWIGPSVVRVTHAVTEQEALSMLRSEEESGHENEGPLSLLKRVANALRKTRMENGAVLIDLPESVCVVRRNTPTIDSDELLLSDDASEDSEDGSEDGSEDASGDSSDDSSSDSSSFSNRGERAANAVRDRERQFLDVKLFVAEKPTDIPQIVSEMMILAGNLVGKFGEANGLALPYRGQNAASTRNQPETEKGLAVAGVPTEIAKRGQMRGAFVTTKPAKHAGLGLDTYVQVTSPIRRYLDLVAHAQIKQFLRRQNGACEKPLPFDGPSLKGLLDDVNEVVSDLRSATRDATNFWQTYWFATAGFGKTHRAVISKWARKEQRVAVGFLTETGIERTVKLAPVETATKRRARIGDFVTLAVKEADPFDNALVFEAVSLEQR